MKIIDGNHDQSISQGEYFKALRPNFSPQVAQKLGLGVVRGQECEERTVAQKRFDETDTNQDKKLSWGEFKTFYVRPVASGTL
jgi:hypothetical protein